MAADRAQAGFQACCPAPKGSRVTAERSLRQRGTHPGGGSWGRDHGAVNSVADPALVDGFPALRARLIFGRGGEASQCPLLTVGGAKTQIVPQVIDRPRRLFATKCV